MTANIPPSQAQLVVTPERAALPAGRDNTLNVLVQLQAPTVPPGGATRAPHHLALVLDRSGSMSGRPLDEAIACARFVIDRLHPDDRVALVTFDNRVEVICAMTVASERARLHAALDAVFAGGSTNLHGGWLAGAEQLSANLEGAGVRRVILLSDGNANNGLRDTPMIAEQCSKLAAAGVTTSTYGLGRDFNEDLMVEMAHRGQGSHYYGETAEDLFEPFDQEFSLLSNLWVRDSTLRVLSAPGVSVQLLNDYAAAAAGEGEHAWRLPDIAYGSEAWAVLRLKVARDFLLDTGATPLLTVRARGIDLDGSIVDFAPCSLALPALSPEAFGAVPQNELVARRAAELEAADILRQARLASRRGNWDAVDALLAGARLHFADNPWVAGVLESIERLARGRDRAMFMKEALYSSRKMSNRLAEPGESAGLAEDAKAAFLRRKTAEGRAQFERRRRDGGSS